MTRVELQDLQDEFEQSRAHRIDQLGYARQAGEIGYPEWVQACAQADHLFEARMRALEVDARKAGLVFTCCRVGCTNETPHLRQYCASCLPDRT